MKSRILMACAAIAWSIPAHAGLVITPQFDGTITSQSVKDTINAAIGVYEGLFSNNIDVNIYFQAFTANTGLGESEVGRVYIPTYTQYYTELVATDANPTAITSLGPNAGVDPVVGSSTILVKSADLRAVGDGAASGLCFVTAGDTTPASNAPNHCGTSGTNLVDGIISLNTNITSPPNALASGSTYSLTSVVEHEIDEVLGLSSALNNTNSTSGTVTSSRVLPEDLWRYNSSGSRVFAVNCASSTNAFFSVNGSGSGQQLNNVCNGDDFGDWQNSGTPQVQDEMGTSGASPTLGPNEFSALTAIGYVAAVPEPGTSALLLVSFAVFGALKMRRNK